MVKKDMSTVNIEIPTNVKNRIKVKAVKEGTTMKKLLEEALVASLSSPKQEPKHDRTKTKAD